MVTITHKFFQGVWYVCCSVVLVDGTRTGTEAVSLPETATDDEIKQAIVASYA